MARAKVNLSKVFGAATQLSSAEMEVARLQEQIEQLKASASVELEAQLEELRQQLKQQSGVEALAVTDIEPNPEQPRKTFSAQSISAMAQTLKMDGQLQPIIVIPTEGAFLLFDGERRWRAAKQLGWQTLQAVTMERPKDLHRKALLTTLHREDLNPLDKAEALLKEIAQQMNISTSEAPRILGTVIRRLDYQKRSKQLSALVGASSEERQQGLALLELNPSESAILDVILGLGLNPASVLANDFRMLSLFSDLQKAIRTTNLKAAHAMALQRLSAKNLNLSEPEAIALRAKTVQEVLEQNLSLAETNQWIREILNSRSPAQVTSGSDRKVTRILQSLDDLPLTEIGHSSLIHLQKSLRQKLKEVEAALKTTQ
jgi:ParB family chromosome partitioning protein